MRTANPALSDKAFSQAAAYSAHAPAERAGAMTIQGTINKTAIMLLLVVGTSAVSWTLAARGSAATMPLLFGGLIGGLVFALITVFRPTAAPYTAPIYALCEGLFLGAISLTFQLQFPGIVGQAVGLTFGVAFCMLLIYKFRIIRVTEGFTRGLVAATGAICLVYLATIVLNLFGLSVPYIHGNGIVGIGFSLFVVVIAALNLVLDFNLIERGAEAGMPKYMEWYGAFGLMVTLIWLYIEILRLLAKLSSRR